MTEDDLMRLQAGIEAYRLRQFERDSQQERALERAYRDITRYDTYGTLQPRLWQRALRALYWLLALD